RRRQGRRRAGRRTQGLAGRACHGLPLGEAPASRGRRRGPRHGSRVVPTMNISSPAGGLLSEASAFLARYPAVEGIDLVLTDCHGIGRGKIIRRHELESLYTTGRGMPGSLFGQDVAGDDVEASGLVLVDGGGDKRCWPLPGTLGLLPHSGRGQVLVSMYQ